MHSRREEKIQKNMYFRTTCGLIGFIVFFLGSFFAFIIAAETDLNYDYTLIFGFGMLFVTMAFFCCVLHESRRIHPTETQAVGKTHNQHVPQESNEPQPEPESPLQPQPEPESPLQPQPEPVSSGKPKKGLHWYDKTRFDFAYVRQIFGLPPRDSDETTSSENDSDPDMLELRKLAKCGLPAGDLEPTAGTSAESQDEDIICESAAKLDFPEAGPSKVECESSEITVPSSKLPLKAMYELSPSDSSKYITDSEEKKAEVSAALSQLSLDSAEKQTSKTGPPCTDSEDKSGEHHSRHIEDSEKQEDGESSKLESRKEN